MKRQFGMAALTILCLLAMPRSSFASSPCHTGRTTMSCESWLERHVQNARNLLLCFQEMKCEAERGCMSGNGSGVGAKFSQIKGQCHFQAKHLANDTAEDDQDVQQEISLLNGLN